MVYRIDPELAREQAQWFVIGLVFFCATIVFLRDHHVLERYRYTIAARGDARLGVSRRARRGRPAAGPRPARALPLPGRRRWDRPAGDAAPAGNRQPGERRVPG